MVTVRVSVLSLRLAAGVAAAALPPGLATAAAQCLDAAPGYLPEASIRGRGRSQIGNPDELLES